MWRVGWWTVGVGGVGGGWRLGRGWRLVRGWRLGREEKPAEARTEAAGEGLGGGAGPHILNGARWLYTAFSAVNRGEKPHKCDKCEYASNDLSNLRTHKKIHANTHTGEKPYKCSIESCDAGFTNAGDLKRHKMIHTGDKPYKCKKCLKGFTTDSNL